MEMNATNLRKNLFSCLQKAADGEPVTVVYKGVRLTISRPSKLAGMKRQRSWVGPGTWEDYKKEMRAEMEKAWEEDWNQI